MDRLNAALSRLSAAVDRLEASADTRLQRERQGDLLAGLAPAGPAGAAEIDAMGRRLDHAIERLRAVLED
jgi:hypothetical protein